MNDPIDDDLEWADVGAVDDWLEDQARLVTIGKRRIGVYRRSDGWYAVKDICPHAGAPLHEGQVVNGAIVCPRHGWAFDLATGAGPGCHVANYPVRLAAGRVQIGY